MLKDLENLPKGTYYILFVKGTDTYDKDIKYLESRLKNNFEVLSKDIRKSAVLIKVKVK